MRTRSGSRLLARRRTTRESGALLQSLPIELLIAIARTLGCAPWPPELFGGALEVCTMGEVCHAFYEACSSAQVWEPLALNCFPRLRSMLQHLPSPHPPFKQLYQQQHRAGAHKFTAALHVRREDYLYTMEVRALDDVGMDEEPFTIIASGRHTFPGDEVRMWTGPEEPCWAKSIVNEYRAASDAPHGGRTMWKHSRGRKILKNLSIKCFVTRADGATFCLYHDVAGKFTLDSATDGAFIYDERHGSCDIFEIIYPRQPPPMANAVRQSTIDCVSVGLTLRKDEADGTVVRGCVDVRFLSKDLEGADGLTDALDVDVRRYLQTHAPFRP